jgi:hypothetical protein
MPTLSENSDLFEQLCKLIVDHQTEHLQWMMDEYGPRMGEMAMSPEFYKHAANVFSIMLRHKLVDAETLSYLLAEMEGLRALYAAQAKLGHRSPRSYAA